MKKLFLLLGAIAAGCLIGLFWKAGAAVLKPVGDVFLNLLFVLVVPMVFFSVTTSFVDMKRSGALSGTLLRTGLAFLTIWLIAGVVAYFSGLIVSPLPKDFSASGAQNAPLADSDPAHAFVNALSVGDFPQLFSKFNLLPMIVFSALLGCGVAAAGEKGEPFARFLRSGSAVSVQTLGVLMKAAPLGLGCYFAGTIASLGGGILRGYLRVLLLYCAVFAVMFFVVLPLLTVLRGKSLKTFWKGIASPSMIALATSSSSAAMPANIEAVRSMGVSPGVATAVVPLATNLLKGGTVMSSVFKVIFVVLLSGGTISSVPMALTCIGVAILSAIVCGAVTNGGLSGDILICSILGADPALVGIIMMIGTIVDIPATLLNSESAAVAAVLSDK